MTNTLVVIINSLKVPKIKKILLYEMKFLVPNYSCLQKPWLGATAPRSPFSLSSVLNWICRTPSPRPPNKIPGYATEVTHPPELCRSNSLLQRYSNLWYLATDMSDFAGFVAPLLYHSHIVGWHLRSALWGADACVLETQCSCYFTKLFVKNVRSKTSKLLSVTLSFVMKAAFHLG